MSFRRYKIDPDTLSFVPVRFGWPHPLLLSVGVALLCAVVWFTVDHLSVSMQERILIAENQALQEELADSRYRVTDLMEEVDELSETDRELYRLILQADTIPEDVRQVGIGGADPYSHFDGFSKSTATLLRDHAEILDELERKVALQNASYRHLETLGLKRAESFLQLPTIQPTQGHLSSTYGVRFHPILHYRRMHSGVDISVPINTPVYATGGGIIEEVGYSSIGYGRYILIDHPKAGYKTLYGHLNQEMSGIKKGVRVIRGQQIALSGNTGLSTAPHVHYEVRDQNNQSLNPIYFFGPSMSPQEYHALLNEAEKNSQLPSLD